MTIVENEDVQSTDQKSEHLVQTLLFFINTTDRYSDCSTAATDLIKLIVFFYNLWIISQDLLCQEQGVSFSFKRKPWLKHWRYCFSSLLHTQQQKSFKESIFSVNNRDLTWSPPTPDASVTLVPFWNPVHKRHKQERRKDRKWNRSDFSLVPKEETQLPLQSWHTMQTWLFSSNITYFLIFLLG